VLHSFFQEPGFAHVALEFQALGYANVCTGPRRTAARYPHSSGIFRSNPSTTIYLIIRTEDEMRPDRSIHALHTRVPECLDASPLLGTDRSIHSTGTNLSLAISKTVCVPMPSVSWGTSYGRCALTALVQKNGYLR